MKKNFMSKKQNENVKLKSGTSRIYEEDDKKVLRPISIEPLMKKSVSKSEDSLDSGIYSRYFILYLSKKILKSFLSLRYFNDLYKVNDFLKNCEIFEVVTHLDVMTNVYSVFVYYLA